MTIHNDLTALKEKRLNWVKANSENGFDEGINRLLTELYPDNAHFIYELLQNAEDPQATKVSFKLTNESVEFSHNGKRLFSLKDVESITSIGNSTKREDATSIGKFGVGFKAVFAYTNTPEIHSGDFHFRIHDLVVPETITAIQSSIEKNQTHFIFPFDNPKKKSEIAVNEVEKGLCELGDNTLLFLSHIRKIDYILPDSSQGSLERIDHENGRIEIRAKHPHSDETVSHWLHFHKDVAVADSDGKEKNCGVAIAYQLERVVDKNKESETWKIAPTHGQVSIYFPAEKETSELQFHIHAPFASTVARDSVRDTPENELLRNHIADLIVESLSAIKEQGLLTMSFLAVLPNEKDGLSVFYEPIQEKIVEAFQTQPLTPTRNGYYAPSQGLYRGAAKIADVITDEDLSVITDYETPLWAANAPQRNSSREDNFLESLSIDRWDFEQLSEIFVQANKEKTESWLETKDDNWLRRFYVLLKDAKQHHEENHYQPWSGKNFPLVRVNSENGMKHVFGNEAYFEPSHSDISANDIQIVKKEVYTKDNTKRDIDENAKNFLESIGVKPFDEKAIIEKRLDYYSNGSNNPLEITEEHCEDIKLFVNYWKKYSSLYSWDQPEDFEEIERRFAKTSFILCGIENSSPTAWRKVSDICLDNPFLNTGLSEISFILIHNKYPMYKGYCEKLNKKELKDLIDFLKKNGVMYCIKIEQLNENDAKTNPQHPYNYEKYGTTGYAVDYSINNLEKYLLTKRISASKLIWNAITNFDERYDVTKAVFKPNRNYQEKIVDSQLIQYLKKHCWIPDKTGKTIYAPRAITKDELSDDFPFDNRNGLLSAIDFGKNAIDKLEQEKKQKEQETAEYKQRDLFAQESGFESLDEMKEAAEFFKELKIQGKTPAEIRAILNPPKPDFSENTSANPNRRAEKVKEEAENAPEKRKVLSLRSVSDGESKKIKQEAKEYLRDNYTFDDVLHCQICQKEMPFKLADGSYYFETVSLLGDVSKVHKVNHIALCPLDSAKFRYANSSENEIVNLIKELVDNRTVEEINDSFDDENFVSLELAGKMETLTFAPKHFGDIKATLEV